MSQTSSYLDLSPLYGDTQEDQDRIRTFKDGKLKPDCFSEQRLLGFPPGCGVLLIMFNRYGPIQFFPFPIQLLCASLRLPWPDGKRTTPDHCILWLPWLVGLMLT